MLDDAGHVKSLQREDAVGMGASSRTLLGRAKENPPFFGALAATAQGKFLPQAGAVLIREKDGNILGAAGASGGTGDEDEAACIAGIEAAGLVAG
ncbi:MAG: heme-binding protein [Reyranella sp.]|nr:heme-binding protein [Reyranella sp.]